MKNLIEEYFDTPEKKAKLYLLITIGQIWAIIAIIIGVVVFIWYYLL
ncbi:MAG: hypothetical protein ACOC40_01215 [Thermoplasmatota archaeon]